MPVDLASLMGSNFQGSGATGADAAPGTPGKKKLKKVGDHWEDEAGVKYADAEGNIALKEDEIPRQKLKDLPNEQAQAAGGAPAQSVMDAFGMEKKTGTAGWGVTGGKPAQEKQPDWQVTPTDQKAEQGGSNDANLQENMSITYPNGLHEKDKQSLKKRWDSLSQAEKEQWLQDARKKKKGGSSSVMGG